MFEHAGALRIVRSQEELGYRLIEWFGDPDRARATGALGREAVAANRGAVDRLVAMVEPLLKISA
jgi:3-deoxy-D-manno-octulosonic-acid transferase